MPIHHSRASRPSVSTSTQLVLREARRLHRAALSGSPSTALPVLRRLLAAQAGPERTLPSLFRNRAAVQRKHVLRALAREAGHDSWEAYCQALPAIDPQQIAQAFHAERSAACLKLWFADGKQAEQHAAEHGGQAVRVGKQAVVWPVDAADVSRVEG